MRYTPGSLVLIVSADHAERDRFARRTLLEDQAAILSLDKVRALLAGRVPEDQVEERAAQLLEAAADEALRRRRGGRAAGRRPRRRGARPVGADRARDIAARAI